MASELNKIPCKYKESVRNLILRGYRVFYNKRNDSLIASVGRYLNVQILLKDDFSWQYKHLYRADEKFGDGCLFVNDKAPEFIPDDHLERMMCGVPEGLVNDEMDCLYSIEQLISKGYERIHYDKR